jgi:hypothetical protein
MQTKRIEIEGRGGRKIFTGAAFAALALGQLGFAFVFAYRFYIVSQNE